MKTVVDSGGGGSGGDLPSLDSGDGVTTEGADGEGEVTLSLSQASTEPVIVEAASRTQTAISGPD